jgi:hypothetical protein
MSIEIPPLVAALFRADTLAILELSHFDGIDAKFLIVGGPARQPKMAFPVTGHAGSVDRNSACHRTNSYAIKIR